MVARAGRDDSGQTFVQGLTPQSSSCFSELWCQLIPPFGCVICGVFLCITLVWSEASHWAVVSDSSWEGLQSRPLSTATCVRLGMPKEVQYDLQFVAACAELVAT